MKPHLAPGVAVVVVGPTTAGCPAAIGHYGTVLRHVGYREPMPEYPGWLSGCDAWIVELARAPRWPHIQSGTNPLIAGFVAANLMPIPPGEQLNESNTDTPVECTTEA